jgi:flagellar hook protein FlgE
MLGTLYVGLAGMTAYSKGLDLISNNVANLNTTGFKAGIASFGDVMSRNGGGATQGSGGVAASGAGVHARTDQKDFSQGDRRDTDFALDAALDGNGFFVLERDGQRYYTRAGDFDFDKDDFLIERGSGAKVMVNTPGNAVGPLNFDAYRVFQPRATTEVKVGGNLARTGTATANDLSVTVHDSSGTTQVVRVRATRNADDPLLWTIEVLGTSDAVLGSGTLRFNADGTPAADNAAITVTLEPTGLPAFTFTLNFGAAGTYAGTTSLTNNGNSSLSLIRQDGVALGTPQNYAFDERGNLEVTYSNQEKVKIGRLVLARFDSAGDLTSIGDGLFVTEQGREPQLSAGLEFGLGRVEGGKLELSNVELTEQFTTLIIIQRGYQACSQMTSVANEMMQQLLAMQDRK